MTTSLHHNEIVPTFFEKTDISVNTLSDSLSNVLSITSIDYADFFLQKKIFESFSLENGLIKSGVFSIDEGMGIRAISDDKTAYAHTNDITKIALSNAIDTVKNISVHSSKNQTCNLSLTTSKNNLSKQDLLINTVNKKTNLNKLNLYQSFNPIILLNDNEKLKILSESNKLAHEIDSRIINVNINLSFVFDSVVIFSPEIGIQTDIRPLTQFTVSVIMEKNGRREIGFSGAGSRNPYAYLELLNLSVNCVKEAIKQASINMEAMPAPCGVMPVVVGPGFPGVLIHEAVGHGLEADFNRKGTSAFTNKIGQQVASKLCTIIDNPIMPGRRGSIQIDDEGVIPSKENVLIENGILKNYMYDKLNAKLMNTISTGNGRRESYQFAPIPRMTNTYMMSGNSRKDEIIESVKHGIYAVNFNGGEVDITSGQFVFSACEAYMIENGKITYPIKGMTLIGNGPEVLKQISMVGNDLELDTGIGICGKDGQQVPVGVGQPTLKIDQITVGGSVSYA